MSENWQITMFTVLGGWLFVVTCAFAGAVLMLNNRVSDAESKMSNRITRIETQFEDWLDRAGILAAKALHSPDNHLGIDYYLDIYIEHHYDMTHGQWMEMRDVCDQTMRNPNATKLEQVQAEFLKSLCDHKISRDLKSNPK